MRQTPKSAVAPETRAFIQEFDAAMKHVDSKGRKLKDCKQGVYSFYDYDEEPIYVGQTREGLVTRVRRHMTNRRTDAVAMKVLDPFEVASLRLYPVWNPPENSSELVNLLDRMERTVFNQAIAASFYGAILNEKEPPAVEEVDLPDPVVLDIVPDEFREDRRHADVRIARRAQVISDLARIIQERQTSMGLRYTLEVQAKRLHHLAATRYAELVD